MTYTRLDQIARRQKRQRAQDVLFAVTFSAAVTACAVAAVRALQL